MPSVTPFLMYQDRLGEALDLYASVFKNFNVIDSSTGSDGKINMATFEVEGQKLMTYVGGPHFKFTEAISLFISVETQEEIDYYWEKLTADGGEESQCGWVKDKFGVSWQIIPKVLMEYISDEDREKANKATQAMLKMGKLDIAELKRAYEA